MELDISFSHPLLSRYLCLLHHWLVAFIFVFPISVMLSHSRTFMFFARLPGKLYNIQLLMLSGELFIMELILTFVITFSFLIR